MPANFGDDEQKANDPSAAEHRQDAEKAVGRNPHPDFAKVQASRPGWDHEKSWHFTKSANPDWKQGDGANDGGESLKTNHVEIDPYEDGRPAVFNYKLLISAIIPRPIGFVGTRSEDGFAGGFSNAKDTLVNLAAIKECTINIISEHFIEAANATSINAPYGTSEWDLTGLTPAPCTDVKCSRVKESIFSVEGKLFSTQEFESRATPGKKTGVLAIVEGVRFWVRGDALNEEKNLVDPAILRPMSRLGGIMYGRTVEGCEIPRPSW
ncbi:MAG: hypothetical protein Q9170_000610 [Blastenia crenularia]